MKNNLILKFIMVNLTVTTRQKELADVYGRRIILVTVKSMKANTKMANFVVMEGTFGPVETII